MTFVHFTVFDCNDSDGDALRSWLKGAPLEGLKLMPGLRFLDLYEPAEPIGDPYLDDGAGPAATLMAGFDSVDAAQAATETVAFQAACVERAGCPVDSTAAQEIMEMAFYPVEGETEPAPLTAPISYVVRYHRPAEDEALFVSHYVKHHPPLLGEFPAIRNVMCYLPVAWEDRVGLPPCDYMLGNEVVFDSLQDLSAAIKSDVRHKLRDDFNTFPPFTGENTHFPMRRTRVMG
jgi:hypothetical protein